MLAHAGPSTGPSSYERIIVTDHPIALSLARLSPTDDWFEARLGPAPEGWLRAGGMGVDPEAVGELERQTRAASGAEDRLSVGTMMTWRWAEVARAASMVYLRERRIPDLDAQAVAFMTYSDDAPTRIAFASPVFACLADDPDASHPDARPVAGLEELRATLVRRIEQFVEPAVQAVSASTGLGRKPAWGLAAGAAIVEMAESLADDGEPERAAEELAALMSHARDLAMAPPSAELFHHDGVPHLALRLGACCRVYRWADRPGSKCAFCPILSRDERLARYREPEHHGAEPAQG